MKIKILTKEELIHIDGGEPTQETSGAYDIVWGLSWLAREIRDGVMYVFDAVAELPPGSQIRGH